MHRVRLTSFPLYGAIVDLMVFCGSFLFSGGPHGPAGPMFVLTVLNAPLRNLARWLVPAEQSSEQLDLLLMFAVVVVNGAMYGAVVAVIVAAWRRAFHKPRSI